MVAALIVVNAWGDVIDPSSGDVVAGPRDLDTGRFLRTSSLLKEHRMRRPFPTSNTVIGVVPQRPIEEEPDAPAGPDGAGGTGADHRSVWFHV